MQFLLLVGNAKGCCDVLLCMLNKEHFVENKTNYAACLRKELNFILVQICKTNL